MVPRLTQAFTPRGSYPLLSLDPKGPQPPCFTGLRSTKAPLPFVQYLLCARLVTNAVAFDRQQSYEVGVMALILQMKKLRHRELS